MNKRGWLRIVEAFFSLLLIAGVLLILMNKGYIGGQNISAKVYGDQIAILREIELDDSLREEILSIDNADLPVEDTIIPPFPVNVKDKIDNRMPDYLTCKSKICIMGDVICELDTYLDKDIYAQSVAITASLEIYSPKQLKLFCWID